jgi:hypothetical protein
LFVAIKANANMKKRIGIDPGRHVVMQFGRKTSVNHRTCESDNARYDVKVDQAVLVRQQRRAAETATHTSFASPAERPIHLGVIQLETLNLPRLFFEQVICVCE